MDQRFIAELPELPQLADLGKQGQGFGRLFGIKLVQRIADVHDDVITCLLYTSRCVYETALCDIAIAEFDDIFHQ